MINKMVSIVKKIINEVSGEVDEKDLLPSEIRFKKARNARRSIAETLQEEKTLEVKITGNDSDIDVIRRQLLTFIMKNGLTYIHRAGSSATIYNIIGPLQVIDALRIKLVKDHNQIIETKIIDVSE